MTLTTKILLGIIGALMLFIAGFAIYSHYQLAAQTKALNESMVAQKQLIDGITRSQAQYVSKDDLVAFANTNNLNLDAIRKDLATLNANITGINQVVVSSSGQHMVGVPSSSTTPNPTPIPPVQCKDGSTCPNPDKFGYLNNAQRLQLAEKFGTTMVPIGSVDFSAWQANPWSYNVVPRNYSVINVLGTDVEGRHYVYNKFTINADGKDYPVQISTSKYEEVYPTPSFSFWNPRLFLGADVAMGVSKLPIAAEFTPGVHLGIMSYGVTKVNPDFSILNVGVGYGVNTKSPQLMISPVEYNIGPHLPLMNNLYVGPSIQLGTDGNVAVGIGLKVGL